MIEIKRAAPQDAIIISRIYAATWKEAYIGMVPQEYLDQLPETHWVDSFHEWIRLDRFRADILYQDALPIGAVAYGRTPEKMSAGWGEIQSLYVLPAYQKMGFGKILIEYAMQELKKLEYKHCYVWVLDENQNARDFYHHLGFKMTEETITVKILEKELTDYKYTKEL